MELLVDIVGYSYDRQKNAYDRRPSFFHGSSRPHIPGSTLKGLPKTTEFSGRRSRDGISVEEFVESHRPSGEISRLSGIYLVKERADLNFVGASERYVYLMQPVGHVTKADFRWFEELLDIAHDERFKSNKRAAQFAQGYWSGNPRPRQRRPLWEYLASAVTILEDVT